MKTHYTKFNQVTSGNLITILTVIVGMGISYGRITTRVDQLENTNTSIMEQLREHKRSTEKLTEVVKDLQIELARMQGERKNAR